MMAVQTLFSLGIVLGYPLLFPTLDRVTVYLIATGAPAISMLSVGLVALPQTVGEQKTEGSLAYMRSLPVPRLSYLVADLTVWLAIVVPGVVLGVLVGAWRFGLDLQVSPLVIPAVLLVALPQELAAPKQKRRPAPWRKRRPFESTRSTKSSPR